MTQQAKPVSTIRDHPWRIAGWSIAVTLWLLPLLAMQFTNEVAWELSDFVIAAVLLGGAGLLLELTVRKSGSSAYRSGMVVAVLATLVLIWINGAVGIIGNENNPLNLMFGGVIVVGLVGALISKFKAPGMARAMVATAVSQALVAVIALVAGHFTFIVSGVFIALWLISARLFHNASETLSA